MRRLARRLENEHCELCLLPAPRWNSRGYERWHLLIVPSGDLLGLLCPGCASDADLTLELVSDAGPDRDS